MTLLLSQQRFYLYKNDVFADIYKRNSNDYTNLLLAMDARIIYFYEIFYILKIFYLNKKSICHSL